MYINTSKDNSGKMIKTGKYGKVKVEAFRNKYRLRFSHLSKRHSITIGDISDESWMVACAKAQEINSDILMERFDDTLLNTLPKELKHLKLSNKRIKLISNKYGRTIRSSKII